MQEDCLVFDEEEEKNRISRQKLILDEIVRLH